MSWTNFSSPSSLLLDQFCVVLDVNARSSGEEGILSSGVPGMIISENEVLDLLIGLSLCLGAVCVMMLFMHCFNTLGWLMKPSIASNRDRI